MDGGEDDIRNLDTRFIFLARSLRRGQSGIWGTKRKEKDESNHAPTSQYIKAVFFPPFIGKHGNTKRRFTIGKAIIGRTTNVVNGCV